ncbi:serine/threonine-protein kinase PLK1 [Ornithorhynchus anatinus]|uniref:Serine/threonine-protein kinase PLK n=1 Tax=Ornithorhynchus anatinus TaxID=9258 RepID=F6W916_ORNAN|nr:serine/threonine-protein kinase PLK1 [Ornithorhynchus anatinus]
MSAGRGGLTFPGSEFESAATRSVLVLVLVLVRPSSVLLVRPPRPSSSSVLRRSMNAVPGKGPLRPHGAEPAKPGGTGAAAVASSSSSSSHANANANANAATNAATNAASASASAAKEIPEVLVDPRSRRRFLRGRFLGKGGFAKCFEITDLDSKEVFAGKIVPKSLLLKPHQKEKMSMEISIHKSLLHRHVVGFHCFFEDSDFVFVVLELCRRRSLLELHKRRKAVTEPEARYYLRQIILGCQYLHRTRVIHRDLKLGNLFLNDDMEVKIGDFGLATKVEYDGERKKTLCGTPNYIAPEVLGKKGHSFEVDVWSIGCIMYTLLVGKPPFETSCLKETYIRIKKNEYSIPKHINPVAASLIQKMLRLDPATRPTIVELLNDEFFTSGYIPTRLPTTCLTIAPRFSIAPNSLDHGSRKPLTVLNKGLDSPVVEKVPEKEEAAPREQGEPADYHLPEMLQQLTTVNVAKPSERRLVKQEEAEDPACNPIFWVSKWVDYSDKYGLGYQLCDNSVGVLFNDSTRLIMYNDGDSLQYIEQDGTESYLTVRSYPSTLTKKITLLKYFRNYMSEHLLKAGANITPREGDELARLPYLRTWFRTRSAIVLHLSNGTVQINFFQDHTKLILCPLMAAVTYIDEKRDFRTYKLSLIEEHGCCRELANRLRYARTMVDKLLSSKSAGARLKASA